MGKNTIYFLIFFSIILLWVVIPKMFVWYVPGGWFAGFFGKTCNLESVFAPISSLFSGLAFGGLIITILLQRKTIIDAKTVSDEQVRNQKELIDNEKNLLYNQSFENNFFNLLRIHKKNVEEVRIDTKKIRTSGSVVKGRSCFKVLYSLLNDVYEISHLEKGENVKDKISTLDNEFVDIACGIIESYKLENIFYYDLYIVFCKEVVSHCHRHIYHILRFIDDSFLHDTMKKTYVRILRAQFNNYEFVVLFYGTLNHREKKFKRLIEKYSFFHNLDKGYLYRLGDQKEYDSNAYGSKGYEKQQDVTKALIEADITC